MLGILCTISNHLSLVVPVRSDQEDTYEEKLKHVQNDVEDNGECSTRSINLLKNITQHLRINALFRIPLYIIVQEQSIISILRTITVILFFFVVIHCNIGSSFSPSPSCILIVAECLVMLLRTD